MRIVNLENHSIPRKAQNTDVGQKQMQATNAAINFLKGKIPEIVPMLTNPTTRSFLTKFFDLIASDPATMNGFRNALQAINAAMQSDASSTTVNLNATTRVQ